MKKQIHYLVILLLLFSSFSFSQETYKIDNTEYYTGEYYSTTGFPLVKRSNANKMDFLRSIGLNDIPEGYQIDHIIPLSEGGTDDPANMQLLTIEEHNVKTGIERGNRSNSTYKAPHTFISTNTSTPNKQINKFPNNLSATKSLNNSTESRDDSSGRIIYTGSRGGKYYINSKGNKVYIKTDKTPISATSKKTYSPTKSYTPSSSSRTIQTGPRGGKYYINKNGNKTYVKKKN